MAVAMLVGVSTNCLAQSRRALMIVIVIVAAVVGGNGSLRIDFEHTASLPELPETTATQIVEATSR